MWWHQERFQALLRPWEHKATLVSLMLKLFEKDTLTNFYLWVDSSYAFFFLVLFIVLTTEWLLSRLGMPSMRIKQSFRRKGCGWISLSKLKLISALLYNVWHIFCQDCICPHWVVIVDCGSVSFNRSWIWLTETAQREPGGCWSFLD